jgi:hypothetical protein
MVRLHPGQTRAVDLSDANPFRFQTQDELIEQWQPLREALVGDDAGSSKNG